MNKQEKYKTKNIEKIRKQSKEYRERPEVKEKLKIKQNSQEHKDYMKEYNVEYIKDEDVIKRNKNNRLLRNYNISLEIYNKMFNDQNGCCSICKKHQSEFKRSLCVDHNHITGKVRALLCSNCNKAIGLLNENIKALEESIKYIKHHEKNT